MVPDTFYSKMRMDGNGSMTQRTFRFKMSSSSGIKENEAIKIDAALKAMKIAGNAAVTREAKKEEYKYFEYEIEF